MIALVLLALAASALAAPQFAGLLPPVVSVAPVAVPLLRAHPAIRTLQRTEYADEAGQYTSSYYTAGGPNFSESGRLVPTNDHRDHVIAKEGSYSYVSPEGIPISVSYIADAYGYRPTGAGVHTPTI